ncbi:hypothetical protein GDO86_000496 [Hymenochirus boettgeri]|uniref:HTH La-type RNA-binding domain-containing protein n=1 Tax=Hymenochirus boettgeri TaxID=247094 RepID=A0A8T2KBY9_9PIPI|nr:hypothetical protein GDO86_000496 [Hymenochirus boettgeri]
MSDGQDHTMSFMVKRHQGPDEQNSNLEKAQRDCSCPKPCMATDVLHTRVTPWTNRKPNVATTNIWNVHAQGQPTSTKVLKAGKPASRKASDFSDITNWPTPSELANHGCQKVLITQPHTKSIGKPDKKRDEERELNGVNETKENCFMENNFDNLKLCDKVETSTEKKKFTKQKWIPLLLEDKKTDKQRKPETQRSARSQSEFNRTPNNKQKYCTRVWHSDRKNELEEISCVRSDGGNLREGSRGRGRGKGYGKVHNSYGDKEYRMDTYPTENKKTMVYYYDDGTGMQIYPVEDKILKEYLKHQIEYYFSSENLEKDFFLRRKMDLQGYLPISLIASFHRVQSLTTDVKLICEALKDSTEVEILDQKIRKKVNPEKWPIPGVLSCQLARTDFSKFVNCPEFIPRSKLDSCSGSVPNSPRKGSFFFPDGSNISNLQTMAKVLSSSMPELDSEPWIEVKRRRRTSPAKPKEVEILTPIKKETQSSNEPEQEELDFMFDEELQHMQGRKNNFTNWSDEDSDYEIDDKDLNKIIIVTQTPPHLKKHPAGDRTGNHVSRAKITSELAKAINDGLYYYEQDLWMDEGKKDFVVAKQEIEDFRKLKLISKEEFDHLAPEHQDEYNLEESPLDIPTFQPGLPESPKSCPVRTPKTPRTPRLQNPNKTPRFYPVVKEAISVDVQSPRKRKTRHSTNPPQEYHVGWVMDSKEHCPQTSSASSSNASPTESAPLAGTYSCTPHSLPKFHHPSHELLKENGFKQQVYHKYRKRCFNGKAFFIM